jgi:hypothetical protein
MSLLRPLALALGLLALAACHRNAAAPGSAVGAGPGNAAPSPVAAPAANAGSTDAAPEDLGDFRIVSVVLGSTLDPDKVVIGDSQVFGRRAAIHASVLSTGANQGLRLSAKWLAPDGSLIAQTEQPVVPTTATATTFGISNPEAWPLGDYQVEIAVNGRLQETRKFQVR